jgi:hypothetical protein
MITLIKSTLPNLPTYFVYFSSPFGHCQSHREALAGFLVGWFWQRVQISSSRLEQGLFFDFHSEEDWGYEIYSFLIGLSWKSGSSAILL